MNIQSINLEEGEFRISLKGPSATEDPEHVGQIVICVASSDLTKPLSAVDMLQLGNTVASFLARMHPPSVAEASAASDQKRDKLWALLDQAVYGQVEDVDIGLSGRIRFALHQNGVRWLGEVVRRSKADLRKWKRIGPMSVKQIAEALRRLNLRLGMSRSELGGWDPPTHTSRRELEIPLPPVVPLLSDPVQERRRIELWKSLDRQVSELHVSVRVTRVLNREMGEDRFLGELVQKTQRDLSQYWGLGRLSLERVQEELGSLQLFLGMGAEQLMGWVPPDHSSRKK